MVKMGHLIETYGTGAWDLVERVEDCKKYLFQKQLELMGEIFAKKKVNISTETMLEKLVLAAFDEWVEAREWWDKLGIEGINIQKEIAFEYIDGLHFALQLAITGEMYQDGVRELNPEVVAGYVGNEDFLNRLMKFFAVPFEVTDNEIIVPKLLSAVLGTLEWKHWKTYENHFAKSYDTFVQNVGKLIKAEALMAYMYIKPEEPLRLLTTTNMHDIWKDVAWLYTIKNFENFARQERGY